MKVERSDLSARAATWTLAGLLGVLAVAGAVVGLFLALIGHVREPSPHPPSARGAPLLQASDRYDRRTIDVRDEERPRGKGGMSIEPAMERTAKAGWDAPR